MVCVSTKLVKNVFCTKLVNDKGDFFGTMVVNGVLARWVLKKRGGVCGWLVAFSVRGGGFFNAKILIEECKD